MLRDGSSSPQQNSATEEHQHSVPRKRPPYSEKEMQINNILQLENQGNVQYQQLWDLSVTHKSADFEMFKNGCKHLRKADQTRQPFYHQHSPSVLGWCRLLGGKNKLQTVHKRMKCDAES